MQKQDLCRGARARDILALISGLVLASHGASARGEWLVDVTANVGYDSNLTRAAAAADVRGDASALVGATGKALVVVNGFDTIVLAADAGGQRYPRYRGLDNAWLGTTFTYRHKTALGYAAPFVSIDATAAYYRYDVDIRTGPRFTLRTTCGSRFGEALDVYAELFADDRHSPYGEPDVPGISGHVFDVRGWGAGAGVAYGMNDSITVSGRGSVRRGDVVSTASETAQLVATASAIAEDPTFGDELYAYRLRGTTYALSIGASYALADRASLTLGYAIERTSVAQGLDYRSHGGTLTFLYRY